MSRKSDSPDSSDPPFEPALADDTSLPTPMEVSFEDLFDLKEIQLLQDQFANATNVASIITRPDGTPITTPSNFCRLCRDIIRNSEQGCLNCYKSDAALGKLCMNGPTIQPCMSGGLWDAGAGISVGGRHIANWLIGQVRDELQSEAKIRAYARKINVDEEAAAAAFSEVPAMSHDQFMSVAQVLFTLAQQLSQTAFQNLQLRRFIVEREEAQQALQQKEERFRNIFNATGDALFLHNVKGHIVDVNTAMLRMFGLTKEDALRSDIKVVLSCEENPLHSLEDCWQTVLTGKPMEFEWTAKRPGDGHCFPTHVNLQRVIVDKTPLVLAVVRDITASKEADHQRLQLEEQLFHSQKMDAIGQLAGGVAHDFNNMLGGILGAAELMEIKLNQPDQLPKFLKMIINSAEKAADLTDKLLSFARRQTAASSAILLMAPLQDALSLLTSAMDRRITLTTSFSDEALQVVGSPSHLQNAFLNILINATQAMPNGGELHVCVQRIQLDDDFCRNSSFDLEPGSFAEITVRDTGSGISPEHLSRIFEPFFTTKEQGKGTGLGLAAVIGTIHQHQGAITVTSVPELGTTFRLLLPLSEEREVRPQSPVIACTHGQGTILLVDDEVVMRTTGRGILEELGYTVLLAEDGCKGLALFEAESHQIDLVILDMIMPEMDGRDCFHAMKKIQPDVRVILASGFSREGDITTMKEAGLKGTIHKPYRSAELSRLVNEILNHP